MDKKFWVARWQENRIGFHLSETNPLLMRYWPEMRIAADACVFVPLCGKSLDLHWLAAQGHRVLGVEISSLAVETFFRECRQQPEVGTDEMFACHRSGAIEILCGDFFDLKARQLARVGAVYDRASLIALPPEKRRQYAAHLLDILPRVPVLLITLEYPPGEMDGPPFSVGETEVESLFGARFQVQRLTQQSKLQENENMRERGLSSLYESVYRLTPG